MGAFAIVWTGALLLGKYGKSRSVGIKPMPQLLVASKVITRKGIDLGPIKDGFRRLSFMRRY